MSSLKVIEIGETYHVEGHPRETFQVLKIYHPPNIPGKAVVLGMVSMDSKAATPAHTHGGSAVIAVVADGTVLNQMNGDEQFISRVGETWYEGPGYHHVRSEMRARKTRMRCSLLC
ncbi:uncharacterized protein BDW47DRAFT_125411 [Aspergillus candidus]|uniref:Cupin 2 conserved barrel domain-containing protein n=1 Tax=Aspergillus candidus TaxID=41067 RepID=A0A2I2FD63_ASPCN|nr:hypothetical protein BDW47DRAFT_125411 [Aspergillus candidus]PLB38581.1 hypothetical protein BDW47DRAFT_125411 [Aspergillus candidus]